MYGDGGDRQGRSLQSFRPNTAQTMEGFIFPKGEIRSYAPPVSASLFIKTTQEIAGMETFAVKERVLLGTLCPPSLMQICLCSECPVKSIE